MESQTESPVGTRPRRRRRWLVALGVLGLLLAVGYPAGRWWYVRSLEAACREAFHTKDWSRLASAAASLTAWRPGRAQPWMYRAQAAHELGNLEDAAKFLDQMPDRDPRTAEALLERASLLFGPLNRPLEGEQTCRRALAINPTIIEAHRRLVYFYAFTLQRQKMVQQIHEALTWDCDQPETYIYLLAQDWLSFGNAYAENTKWMKSDPDNELFLVARAVYRVTSRALDEQPGEELSVGDADEELPYHEKVLADYFERFPRNMELLIYYVRKASANGESERVAELLAQAPPEAAQDNRFWRYKGWLHQVRGEMAEAEAAYREALRLNPYDYIAPHQLAAVLRQRQEKDEMEMLEQRYQQGQQLRREVLALPDVTKAPPSLLWRIANHAATCGEISVAQKLARRLEMIQRMP